MQMSATEYQKTDENAGARTTRFRRVLVWLFSDQMVSIATNEVVFGKELKDF